MSGARKPRQTERPVPCLTALLLICLLLPACAAERGGDGPSAPSPVRKTIPGAFPNWEQVLDAERALSSFGEEGLAGWKAEHAAAWKALRARLADAPLRRRAEEVNAFFNRWPFADDRKNWGLEDYWATPREFSLRGGDCEEYAIAKYYALRDLGVPPKDLRIALVEDRRRGYAEHAVLLLDLEGETRVLDNLTRDIRPQSEVRRYILKFSLNEEHLWRHRAPSGKN